MNWLDRAMQLADDYAVKLGVASKLKDNTSSLQEAALARIALIGYLEAAVPKRDVPSHLMQ